MNGVLTNPRGERNTSRDEIKEWHHFSCTRVELQGRSVVNGRLQIEQYQFLGERSGMRNEELYKRNNCLYSTLNFAAPLQPITNENVYE
jgi:hypothetical protein